MVRMQNKPESMTEAMTQPVTEPMTKSLTVLHIAPTPFFSDRGCHMRIQGIVRALNKRGITSVVCTYNLGRDVEGVETVRTASIPGYTKLEAGPSAFKYLADILLFFKVCGLISSRKPDIIHAHLHEGALIGWAARLVFSGERFQWSLMFKVAWLVSWKHMVTSISLNF